MPDDIRRLIGRMVAAINNHDIDGFMTCYADHYEGVDVTYTRPIRGIAEIRRIMTGYFEAIPDLQIFDDVLVDGNHAVLNWTGHGTHRGTLLRVPATGYSIQVRGMAWFVVEQAKIIQGVHVWDVAGFLRTIRLLPDL